MKYRLKEIQVSNFKIFKDDFKISFDNCDFSILGGPNGFGKTSIFDAIELAFTGNVSRLSSIEGGSGCCDVLVQNSYEKPTFVRFSLVSHNGTVSFVRKLKGGTLTKSQKKSSNFEQLWDFFQYDESETENRISQSGFEKKIGFFDLKRYFNLFYYVQQEETTHFLKSTDKARLQTLSELFDTKKEIQGQDKINLFKSKLNLYKVSLKKRISALEQKLSTSLPSEIVESKSFHKIFSWLETPPLWDLEKLNFTGDLPKEKMLNEIAKVEAFIRFKNEFAIEKDFEDNFLKLKTWANNVLFSKVLPELPKLEKLLERKIKLEDIFEKLKKDEILQKLSEEDLLLAKEDFSDLKAKSLSNSVNILKKTQEGLGERCKVYNEFLTEREELSEKFKNNLELFPNNSECPLCGFDFKSLDDLLNSLKRKQESLQVILTSDQEAFKKNFDIFWSSQISPLRDMIIQKLNQAEFKISSEFISYLKNASERKVLIEEIYIWLSSLEVDIEDCFIKVISNEKSIEEMIRENKEKLIEKVQSCKPLLSGHYIEAKVRNDFKSIFANYFLDLKNQIASEDLSEKKLYIEYQYFNSLNKEKEELAKLNKKHENIERLLAKAQDIFIKYRGKIRNHWKEIAKEIEIPFFLYSNKILQRFDRNGLGGIFLKDPLNQEELKSIRFVSDFASDHDVINTMSSGQLSGIVIALTLAMNKLFGKGFDTILIDDPVQTMDDINMMSFIDLMRNEFKDKQVIMSSHEDEIEKFFLYRYMKAGKKVQRINVMERISYQ